MDVEIDPKLFVTCRLCLEELGVGYQIVPAIQRHIKYCYDIDVHPFDGLPQLICKKCKITLNEFCSAKEKYIFKQNELKEKMADKPMENLESQPELVHSSQQQNDDIWKKPKKSISVSSDKEEDKNNDSDDDVNENVLTCSKENTNTSVNIILQKKFEKHFVCRFCNQKCVLRNEMTKHLKCHDNILNKYGSILKKCSVVKLNKIDDSTQISKAIIFDNCNILENINNSYFYVKYESKSKRHEYSSDENDEIFTKIRKRKRILSTSSNDTVVIENNKKAKSSLSDSEDNDNKNREAEVVIHIDDSSEDESDTTFKVNPNIDNEEFKSVSADTESALQEIVNTCQMKYDQKINLTEDDRSNNKLRSQLKKIVLNIGRKAINKAGFNCKGLLTYLEHKSLEIVWVPKIDETEKKYVLIMAKEKDRKERSNFQKLNQILDKNDFIEPDKFLDQEEGPDENTIPKKYFENKQLGVNSLQDSDMSSNKLLNASPVSNPKKLPKKNNDQKINIEQKTKDVNKISKVASSMFCDDLSEEAQLRMPIITSTTSLAPPMDCELNNSQVDSTNDGIVCETTKSLVDSTNVVDTDCRDESTEVVKPAPRIKVKPVSELMPQRVLNDLNKQSKDTWDYRNDINMLSTSPSILPTMSSELYSTAQSALLSPTNYSYNVSGSAGAVAENRLKSSHKDNTIILDTADLPNTLTDSPYIYFKNLLIIHNIDLVNPSHITTNFVSLIKFRLRLNQEIKNKPIELCLSLLCENNRFCLCVNDSHNTPIDWTTLSANWQWEILKIFMGNVVAKILENAQKLGPVVFENANKVLRLLKSIQFRKAES